MSWLPDRRPAASFAACVAAALIALPCAAPRALHAQSNANPRFDALVSLAEAKTKEGGVPGVALGVVSVASISRTFAATAMMRLVEQRKVDADRASPHGRQRIERDR